MTEPNQRSTAEVNNENGHVGGSQRLCEPFPDHIGRSNRRCVLDRSQEFRQIQPMCSVLRHDSEAAHAATRQP